MVQIKSLVGLLIVGQALSACGNSTFLQGMNLAVNERNSQNYIDLSAQIDMGNISLDGLSVPIYDPHSNIEIGTVGLGASSTGKQQITLSLNATSVLSGDPTLGTTLPNGRALPSAVGAPTGELMGIQVLDYSRVYVGGDLKSTIYVGIALSIQALDSVTSNIGNANLFFAQTFNSNLSGVAGIYTSANAHQNGIAVFGKYTAPVSSSTTVTAAAAKVSTQQAQKVATASKISVSGKTTGSNTVVNDNMSQNGEQKVYNYFYGKKRSIRPH